MDRISNLPPPLIETILCLVPIQEAARTSILSKEWRYRWTKISKLVFKEDTFKDDTYTEEVSEDFSHMLNQRKRMSKRCKLFSAIYQILLKHVGPIHEFSLSIYTDKTCVEIDHIIYHLLRNNSVKKLTLDTPLYKLPLSIFSLHHLTDLYLNGSDLDRQPPFSGFGSLTNLDMESVTISEDTLLHLLSNCPLLINVTLIDIEYTAGPFNFTIENFFERLPVVENLYISLWTVTRFLQDGIPLKLPTPLVRLKHVYIDNMCFRLKTAVSFLFLLMRSSPNLKKLKLQVFDFPMHDSEMYFFTPEDYLDIWLEHMNEFKIKNVSDEKDELDFVKLILAKSPVLKKVKISLWELVNKNEELQITRTIFAFPRASPVVTITVERGV